MIKEEVIQMVKNDYVVVCYEDIFKVWIGSVWKPCPRRVFDLHA